MGVSVGLVLLIATTVLIMNLEKLVGFARSNITELDRQKQKLFRQAMFDEVSNLHNRNYLISRLEAELARIRRSGNSALSIFLDVDGFKMVNDTMGHSAGNDLLRPVEGGGSSTLCAVRTWSADSVATNSAFSSPGSNATDPMPPGKSPRRSRTGHL